MKEEIKKLFSVMNDTEIVQVYNYWLDELKERKIIRNNNVVGEIGEYYALKYYNENPELPNLKSVPIGTKHFDAISINGDRYSIKATRNKSTGVFNGLNDINTDIPEEQQFEYVIIVQLNSDYSVKAIYEINWKNFLHHKKWNSSKRTWNLSLSKHFEKDAKLVF
ncbi:DUF6998 domain-containing protein [Gottfriedia acidiceleris]|uniref:DUF6998 domain-containing protein n=1 Tax=Gottfriedia acidiceleris TaxID=371036 RepID=UPI00101BFADA|nr:hypothetical protein [Gottfriedia acidiceleris]